MLHALFNDLYQLLLVNLLDLVNLRPRIILNVLPFFFVQSD
jgi:hypothetical protein